MIFSAKRSFSLLIILLFAFHSPAQTGFAGGYNVGCFTSPMHNLEVMTYEFNKAHPNYSNKYDFVNFYRGLTFMFYHNSEKGGWELMWSNKHIISTAVGSDLPTDTVYRHEVKARMNTISIGGYHWLIQNKLNIGMDYDIMGFCRFYKKIGPDADFKNQKWVTLFDKKGFLVFGFTFFAEMKFGPIKIRPYYQWTMLPGTTSYGTNNYAFKTTNYGVAGYLTIQKKSD